MLKHVLKLLPVFFFVAVLIFYFCFSSGYFSFGSKPKAEFIKSDRPSESQSDNKSLNKKEELEIIIKDKEFLAEINLKEEKIKKEYELIDAELEKKDREIMASVEEIESKNLNK